MDPCGTPGSTATLVEVNPGVSYLVNYKHGLINLSIKPSNLYFSFLEYNIKRYTIKSLSKEKALRL